ncbi:MAG: sigma-70 family RNA polymerase sigma factor [Verrucomicrobiae bacterium]|nr:sigma-70 family RNA polymerase sigma factor [Verrucomicrobiae bacterium]
MPGAADAIETLCRAYWYPLYAYVRRHGHSPADAEDLTQEFFARLIRKKHLRLADPERGRFRTFLLTSLRHFLFNEWARARTGKRGRGHAVVPLDPRTAESLYANDVEEGPSPEALYDRRWAVTLLERSLRELRERYASAGKAELFEVLKASVWGAKGSAPYGELATRLGMSEGAVKVAVHRLRRRFRDLLRTEVGRTVGHPDQVDGELRDLMAALGNRLETPG